MKQLADMLSLPCDTPTYPVSELQKSNEGLFKDLDFSSLSTGYASKTGIFSPEQAAERARKVRVWLRERPEQEIVGEPILDGIAIRLLTSQS